MTEDINPRRPTSYEISIIYTPTYMLIYQQDANVLPLARKVVKGMFDGGVFRLGVHDQEIPLRVRRGGDVLQSFSSDPAVLPWPLETRYYPDASQKQSCDSVLDGEHEPRTRRHKGLYRPTYLVADDGKELSVFVCRRRSCHARCWL